MVSNTGDNGGANPAAHAGTGTLRQAIIDSNADGGAQNIIEFDIPGTGPFVITIATQLPIITSNVGIDGFSQSGTLANTNLPALVNIFPLSGTVFTNAFSFNIKIGRAHV